MNTTFRFVHRQVARSTRLTHDGAACDASHDVSFRTQASGEVNDFNARWMERPVMQRRRSVSMSVTRVTWRPCDASPLEQRIITPFFFLFSFFIRPYPPCFHTLVAPAPGWLPRVAVKSTRIEGKIRSRLTIRSIMYFAYCDLLAIAERSLSVYLSL